MKRLIFIISILFLSFPLNSYAFTVTSVNDTSNYLDLPPFYYAPNDEIRIKYKTREVTTVVWDFTNPTSGTVTHKELNAPDGFWYVASGFTCVGTYTTTMKNRNGNTLASMTIVIDQDDLQNPKCNSDGSGESSDDPNYPDPSGGSTSCVDAICECINELKSVNQQINDSVNSNGYTLSEIKQNTAMTNVKLDTLTNVTENILGELKTNDTVSSGNVPTVDIPSSDGMIERNKPDEQPVFEDDTIYFKDEGDVAEAPGKMPVVPDVKDWDGVTREDEGTKESELTKENERSKENELIIDQEKTKENELQKDEQKQKDNELSKDIFQKDEQLQIEENQQSDYYNKDSEMTKNHEYQQTNQYP